MKFNKLAVLAVIALGLSALSVNAQDKPKHEGKARAETRVRRGGITEELGLTAEQKTKWAEVMRAQGPKAKAIREDSSLTAAQKREKLQALRKDLQEKMKAILTPEQQEKLAKLRKEHQASRKAAKSEDEKK